jgi:hypothetical protein
LRTACDLDLIEVQVMRPSGFTLPSASALAESLPGRIAACKELFREPAVHQVTYKKKK